MFTQKSLTFFLVIALSLILILAFGEMRSSSVFAAQPTANPTAFQANNDELPPVPPPLRAPQSQARPATLSPTLSYYFIPGNTFTSDLGNAFYVRQVNGCVNQMPLNYPFSAPVHLPQGSEIVSITLYTYNNEVSSTTSSALFLLSDGKGLNSYTHSADSQPNIVNYQQNTSTIYNPLFIDNQNYHYYVQWRKTGVVDSLYLSLCGVRVAYYAPTNAIYLPTIIR